MRCKANGCPLKAVHVTDRHPPEKGQKTGAPKWGVCDYHKRAPGHQWTEATSKIDALLPIIRALSVIDGMPQRFKPLGGEDLTTWKNRVMYQLDREILGHELKLSSSVNLFDEIQELINQAASEAKP